MTTGEPGLAFSIHDALITDILFSAADIKVYAYRWGAEHDFQILVQRPGRDGLEHCVGGTTFERWFKMTTEMVRGDRLAEPVAAKPNEWAVLQLVAHGFVVELPEWRLLLPSASGAPIIAEKYGTLGQHPIDWNPELFALVKSGCAGLGAHP